MRKTLLLAVPAVMISYQTTTAQGPTMELPTVYIQNTVTGSNRMPTNVLGSPYLNEEFKMGTVTIKNEESYKSYLRYNAYNDEIEMKDGATTTAVMKRDYITVRLGADVFSIHTYAYEEGVKDGYFNALNEGKAQLLRRRKVYLKAAQAATSSYSQDKPPKFEMEESFYISINGETAQPVRLNKKGVLSLFSDYQTDLSSYVKENKMKLKSTEEVVKLLEYYNTLGG